jgi:hypothetical protein
MDLEKSQKQIRPARIKIMVIMFFNLVFNEKGISVLLSQGIGVLPRSAKPGSRKRYLLLFSSQPLLKFFKYQYATCHHK